MIGETISHYRLIDRLGRGGMGVVYRAEDLRLDRTVALKLLPPHALMSRDEKARFYREARAAAAINNANIAHIYEIDEVPVSSDGGIPTTGGISSGVAGSVGESRPFIAMEYVDGESLAARISRAPLPLEDAAEIGAQIANGLAAAHSKGVVHRDIKPHNVMVTREGVVKILDFGVARTSASTRLTTIGSTLGTVAYMSPEQARGEEVDHRTDLWSLGVVLYEMLSGRCPFDAEYEQALIYQILNEEPPPIRELVPEVDDSMVGLIARLLKKDPDLRPSSAMDVVSFLQEPQPRAEGAANGGSRHFLRGWTTAAVVVAAVAVLMLIYSSVDGLIGAQSGSTSASVAVLPLRSSGPETERYHAGESIAEALIMNLSRDRRFERVLSMQSVMRFAGSVQPPSVISEELGVDYLVSGSVRMEEDRLSIYIELSDTESDAALFSNEYGSLISDILTTQGSIAREVAERIFPDSEAEAVEDATRRVNPEAYRRYLEGRHFWRADRFTDAEEAFQEAIGVDSTLADAYAALGETYLKWAHGGLHPQIAFPKAISMAEASLELDPNNGAAVSALADARYHFYWDFTAAEEGFLRAIELAPRYNTPYWWYAGLLSSLDRSDEAISMAERAMELDPGDPAATAFAGFVYFLNGDFDRALELENRSLAYNPAVFTKATKASVLVHMRRFERARDVIESIPAPGPRTVYSGILAAASGREADARRIAARLDSLAEQTYIMPYQRAKIYAQLGDKDAAFALLNESARLRDAALIWLNREPVFEPLRNDERYRALLDLIRLPDTD